MKAAVLRLVGRFPLIKGKCQGLVIEPAHSKIFHSAFAPADHLEERPSWFHPHAGNRAARQRRSGLG